MCVDDWSQHDRKVLRGVSLKNMYGARADARDKRLLYAAFFALFLHSHIGPKADIFRLNDTVADRAESASCDYSPAVRNNIETLLFFFFY